jgi:cell division septation protein DedD
VGGGYSVQVTSQRSEADAESSYKELQAKYPGQLASHHASIRRADLGEKGTYYRAMVGPFASAEAAAASSKGISSRFLDPRRARALIGARCVLSSPALPAQR